jgi:hypothetical protein
VITRKKLLLEHPLAILYLTMLQTAGVPTKAFADSTEPLSLT